MESCLCSCHTNPVYGSCDTPGGCGSVGCDGRGNLGASQRQCIVCPQFGREKPNLCDRPPVCERCRLRVSGGLAQVPVQYAALSSEPGSGAGERISGTREKPLGVRVGALDQLTPVPDVLSARLAVGYTDHLEPEVRTTYETTQVTELVYEPAPEDVPYHGPVPLYVTVERLVQLRDVTGLWVEAGDQTGEVPVAAWLDSCVRDWMTYGPPGGQRLPVPTVERLTKWLQNRLHWAYTNHPAIDEFAAELHHALAVLRTVNGDVNAKPEVKIGVECRNCDSRSSLQRAPGDDWIVCQDCQYDYSPDEYTEWVDMLHGHAKQHYRYDKASKKWMPIEEEGAA